MSAAEIIEQIKALPKEEQREVFQFIHQVEAAQVQPSTRTIRYADDDAAKAAGDCVVQQYPETFRRLAE